MALSVFFSVLFLTFGSMAFLQQINTCFQFSFSSFLHPGDILPSIRMYMEEELKEMCSPDELELCRSLVCIEASGKVGACMPGYQCTFWRLVLVRKIMNCRIHAFHWNSDRWRYKSVWRKWAPVLGQPCIFARIHTIW